jgi:HEAT repeat protein
VTILTDVLRDGPDESLRMEAARNLEMLRGEPGATDALRSAMDDASPYVRLAALRSSRGSSDPLLGPVLEAIAAHDQDAGVRALAREVLASLHR